MKVTFKTGETVDIPPDKLPVEIPECGSCGHYHLAPLHGGIDYRDDCRYDDNRYTFEELDALFGPEGKGWIGILVEDQEEED